MAEKEVVLVRYRVVLHHNSGKLTKGFTSDFLPARPEFHVEDWQTGETTKETVSDLKGVFFVKTFDGKSKHQDAGDAARTGMGKKIRVEFKDGETIVGYTSGYSPNRETFFVFPVDPKNNNEKIFVVSAATANVAFVD